MERRAQRKETEDVCPRGPVTGRLKAAGMSRCPWNREGREMRFSEPSEAQLGEWFMWDSTCKAPNMEPGTYRLLINNSSTSNHPKAEDETSDVFSREEGETQGEGLGLDLVTWTCQMKRIWKYHQRLSGSPLSNTFSSNRFWAFIVNVPFVHLAIFFLLCFASSALLYVGSYSLWYDQTCHFFLSRWEDRNVFLRLVPCARYCVSCIISLLFSNPYNQPGKQALRFSSYRGENLSSGRSSDSVVRQGARGLESRLVRPQSPCSFYDMRLPPKWVERPELKWAFN